MEDKEPPLVELYGNVINLNHLIAFAPEPGNERTGTIFYLTHGRGMSVDKPYDLVVRDFPAFIRKAL